MISSQTSVKVVGGHGTSVNHMLAMALDAPSVDKNLREAPDSRNGVRNLLYQFPDSTVILMFRKATGPWLP